MSQSLYEVIKPDVENDVFYDRDDQAAWYTGLEKRRIRTLCGDLNVSLGGIASGKVMVFWSSLMLNGSMWKFQYEAFKSQYRIILIDSPGHGESEALRRTMDLRDSAQCVVDILDHLKIDKCILIGNSWGAMLASVFPAYFPERTITAVAINARGSLATQEETIKFTLAANFLGMFAAMPKFMANFLAGLFPGNEGAKSKPQMVEYLQNVIANDDPKSLAWALRSMLIGRKDVHHLTNSIKNIPVLIVAGEQDSQFPVWAVRQLADSTPSARFVVIGQTGHLAALESPGAVNREITSFLRDVIKDDALKPKQSAP